MQKLISQGAESKLYLTDNKIIKDRFKKEYRIKEIDEKLRKFRTKRESKILEKLSIINFPSPKLIDTDKEKIIMNYVKGPLVKNILEKNYKTREQSKSKDLRGFENQRFSNNRRFSVSRKSLISVNLVKEIGEKIAVLHNNNIIHGDLTTSNMIFNKEVFFIDFGLSFFSHKIEDKAVDLHLLKQALESKHYKIWEKAFKIVLESYKKKAENSDEILKRLEKVEKRGRYKQKK